LELKARGDLGGGFVAVLNLLLTTFLARLAFEEGASNFVTPNASRKVTVMVAVSLLVYSLTLKAAATTPISSMLNSTSCSNLSLMFQP